jgi:hypothetical protein
LSKGHRIAESRSRSRRQVQETESLGGASRKQKAENRKQELEADRE